MNRWFGYEGDPRRGRERAKQSTAHKKRPIVPIGPASVCAGTGTVQLDLDAAVEIEKNKCVDE